MSKFFPLKLEDVSNFHFACLWSILLIFLTFTNVHAQNVPEAINYQAIVRDAETFQPISEQVAYVSVEFLDGPDGDVLYQEEFPSIQTGKAGLINLSLGQGDPMISSFGSIAWDSGNVWLRLSVDIGNGLNILQETPFNTVPYAFYAETSGGSDDDSDPTNELIQSISLDVSDLEIVEGDQTTTVDLSSLIDDNDSDPTNERIDSLRYNADARILSVFESGSQFDVEIELGEIENDIPQDLFLDEDEHILTITDNDEATEINLSPYLDNTDEQMLTLNSTILRISGSESEVDLADLPNVGTDDDPDPFNEIQNLQLEGNTLTITNNPDANPIALGGYLDNTDNQDLSLAGTTLTLTGDGTTVDLSALPGLGPDDDADPDNELQDIELNGDELSITNNPLATPIDLSPYLDNTDNQDLSLSGTTLTLTGDGTTVDLAVLPGLGPDADDDPDNERQDLELVGNDLSITNNPLATPIDLSPYLDNTDNQDLSLSGTTLTLTGDGTTVDLSALPGLGPDDDADPDNERQDLELVGNDLSITNNPLATPVDLSRFDNSQLQQNHIFIGDGSNEAQEVEITGDLNLAISGEITVTGLQSVDISNVAPTAGQVLAYNALESEWQPRSPGAITSTSTTSYYSIDPFDFVEIADAGVDLGANNALKFYNEDGPFAMLLDNEIISMAAPIHLPHGAEINNLKIYFRDSGPGNVRFSLLRKNMTDFSTSDQSITTVVVGGLPGDKVQNINIVNNNVIDNSVYSYRLLVRLSATEPSESVAIDGVQQAVYGAIIEYTTN